MFEKEAKEYVPNINWHAYSSKEIREEMIVCYQKGAEFGYNKAKANEWHKQDIDDIYDSISKDWSVRYFICVMKDKSRVTAIGNCDEGCGGEVSVNLFFDHDDEKYYMDDIVWWKEIILPTESRK